MKSSILSSSIRRFTLGLAAAGLLIAALLPTGASAASISGGSTLLSEADANQLENWLGEGSIILTKIFSTTVGDGKTATQFHAAADGQGRTLTVAELPAQSGFPRKVIGGYNPQSWNSSNTYNITSADAQRTAFLFNLTTGALQRQKLGAGDGNYGQYQTYNDANLGPAFGIGHDLYIDASLHSGAGYQYSYGPSGFGAYAASIAGGGQGYGLSYGTVEVFTVTLNPNAAPAVVTNAATGTSPTGATLNAVVSSNLNTTDVVFQYSLDPTLTTGVTTTAVQTQASNLNNVAVSAVIGSLTANSTYYFRAVATNALGTRQGSILSFVASNPSVPGYTFATAAYSSTISSYTLGSEFTALSAVTVTHLGVYDHGQNGLVANMPVGLWNTSGTLLAQTTVLTNDPLTGSSRYHALTTPVTLTANTRYIVGAFYPTSDVYGSNTSITVDARIAYYGSGYTSSGSLSFPNTRSTGFATDAHYFGANFLLASPVPTAPTVTTAAANSVSNTGATLNATVSSNNATTDVTFQYSTDPTLTTNVTTTAVQTLGSTATNSAVSATLSGLATGSTYYFRAAGTNSVATTHGAILSFVAATPTVANYSYTGGVQTYVVPAGVTSVNVDVSGAEGGTGSGGTQGGLGGRTTATLAVTPGQTLQIYVGGQGVTGNGRSGSVAPGGFNGGGFGGYDITGGSVAGGGGGASDIRLTSSLNDRVIVAGGGGGGLANGGTGGGSGGGLNGGAGGLQNSAVGGGGGTQTAGGTAYTARGATAGSFGQGGNGSSALNAYGSAGGGGGYYGGGGGSGTQDHGSGWSGSGGGGSAYAHPTLATGVTMTSGTRSGNGSVSITYTAVVSNPEIAIEQPAGAGNNIATGGSKAFGSVDVGSTSDLVFTLKNTGGSNLTLSGAPDKVAVTGSSDFTVTAQPTSPVTAAGSTTFTVRFAPSSSGAKTAALSIANNDADENPFVVNLTGTGLNTAPVITNHSSATSASLSFAENSAATIIDMDATDTEVPASQTITFSKSGADEALFNIDSSTGVLAFVSSRNFEVFSDADSDGIYEVTVTATDSGAGLLTDSQALTITITDVNEMPSFAKGADQSLPALIMVPQSISGWATAINDGDSSATQTLTFNVSVASGAALFTTAPAISSDGTLTYRLGGAVGTAVVSVTLTDDASINGTAALTTGAQTFSITSQEAASTGHVFDAAAGLNSGGFIYRPMPGVINNASQISFKAMGQANSGGFTSANDSMLITNVSGDFQVIGQEATAAPGGGSLSGSFNNLVLSAGGQTVASERFLAASTSTDNGYVVSGDGLSLEMLSREGSTATEGGIFTGHTGRHAVDDEERIYFPGTLSGVPTTKNSGTWYDEAGTIAVLAKEGDDVGPVTGDLAWLGNFSAPLSAAGEGAAFVAALQNNPDIATQKTPVAKNAAIFSGAPESLELVARKGDLIPAVGKLGSFSAVSRGGNGDHAFISLLTLSTAAPVVAAANDQVIMAEIGGVKHLVARENTTELVGSLKPVRLGNVYMTSAGEAIYQAWLTGAGVTLANDSVLCRWTVAGSNEVLAREGDSAPGTGSTYLAFQAFSVSSGGAVVLQSTLGNSQIALMRALPGAGLTAVVQTGTTLTYNGASRSILSLGIHQTGAGAGGGGGGLGAAINDEGAIFTVLSIGASEYVTRVYRP